MAAILPVLLAAVLAVAAARTLAATDEEVAALCREAQARHRQAAGPAETDGKIVAVLMYKDTFCPRRLTVRRGDVVRWTNVDRRTSHSVWFKDAGLPESDRKFPQEHVEMKIELPPGEHRYLCGPHWEREGMIGTLVVE